MNYMSKDKQFDLDNTSPQRKLVLKAENQIQDAVISTLRTGNIFQIENALREFAAAVIEAGYKSEDFK